MQANEQQLPRRRFFRHAAMAGAFAGLGGFGLGALAHGRGGQGGAALEPAELKERLDRMLKHLYAEIDATQAQQQRLDPIVRSAVEDLMPLRRRLREARLQAMDLFTRDHIDRAAFEKLRAEQMELADRASKRLTEALADAAEVLTPLQRKQLAERFRHARGRRWHGRG